MSEYQLENKVIWVTSKAVQQFSWAVYLFE